MPLSFFQTGHKLAEECAICGDKEFHSGFSWPSSHAETPSGAREPYADWKTICYPLCVPRMLDSLIKLFRSDFVSVEEKVGGSE